MAPFKSVEYASCNEGPRLLVLGAVHGKETCGTAGIHETMSAFDRSELALLRGRVTFVPIVNQLAHSRGTRSGDRNLNRGLRPTSKPSDNEDHVANWLCPLLASHQVLLDLHSFQADGDPFVFVGPANNNGAIEPFCFALEEESLASRLGVGRLVDGWLSTYAGGVARRRAIGPSVEPRIGDAHYGIGTTEYMRSVGGWGVTLECGQHDDPRAPQIAHQAILSTLRHLGMVDGPEPATAANLECVRLCEVVDRAHEADAFGRTWRSFDPVRRGELIAKRANGDSVSAPFDGFIVFPNANAAPDSEWFYLAQASNRLPPVGAAR